MQFQKSEQTLKQSSAVATVFCIQGEVTKGSGFDNLKNELANQSPEKRDFVILDMGDVYYINSSGMGALLSIFNGDRKLAQKFTIVNLQPHVAKVFLDLNLFKILRYFDSLETALEKLD